MGEHLVKRAGNQDAVKFLVHGAQLNLLAEVDKEPAFFALAGRPASAYNLRHT